MPKLSASVSHMCLDVLDLGILIVCAQRRVGWMNRWLQERLRGVDDPVQGRCLTDIFPDLTSRRFLESIDDALERGLAGSVSHAVHGNVLPLYEPGGGGLSERRLDHEIRIKPLTGFENEVPACLVEVHDITSAVKRDQLLRRRALEASEARHLAEQFVQRQAEFVSYVSHELRTPVTAIRGAMGLILSGAVEPVSPAVANLVEISQNSCERLLRLINNVLDLDKIQSGKMEFHYAPVRLGRLVELVLEQNRPLAAQHQIRLEFHDHAGEARVWVDSDRFIQALTNLVYNAIKFSPQQGVVSVTTHCPGGSRVRVDVSDHGPGIPEEFRELIFDRFAQMKSPQQRFGTGLGLPISKSIVEEMNGRIGLRSGSGQGATFYVELPRYDTPENVPGAAGVLPGRSQVLICCREPLRVSLCCRRLKQCGVSVDIAGNFQTAQALFNGRSYDLVVVEAGCDDGSSLAGERWIRTVRERGAPVILYGDDGARRRWEECGIGICETLPAAFSEPQLFSAVMRCLPDQSDIQQQYAEYG